MNSKRKILLVVLLIILLGLFATLVIVGDPFIIIILVIVGTIGILNIFSDILEKKYPKNKLSRTLKKMADWVEENIRL